MSVVRLTQGFALLEAIVALTIVGLVGVGALGALNAQLAAVGKARATLEATTLAEEQLAQLRVVPASSLNPLADSLRRGRFAAPFASYAWERTVRPILGMRGLYQAIVEVRWSDGVYRLDTRLFRPERQVVR